MIGEDYNALFKRWYYTFYPMAKSIVSNYGDLKEYTKDIFHDSLIVLYEKITHNELRLTSELGAYLRGIIDNKCKELNRKKNPGKAGKEEISDFSIPYDKGYNIELDIKIKQLEMCIEALIETRKTIIKARHYDKLSNKEIAERYDFKNDDSVKAQHYKAVQDLENCLKKYKN